MTPEWHLGQVSGAQVMFEGFNIPGFFPANATRSFATKGLAGFAAAALKAVPGFALLCFALIGTAAAADVLEISSGGQVMVRENAGAAIWEATGSGTDRSEQEPSNRSLPVQTTGLLHDVVPKRFVGLVQTAADSASISPALLAALIAQESGWNPQAVSSKGALGLAQLMPATARELGVDPRDPAANLLGGALYLRRLLDSFDGDIERALAAYNAGPGRVRRANGIPAIAETQAYVRSIVKRVASSDQEVM